MNFGIILHLWLHAFGICVSFFLLLDPLGSMLGSTRETSWLERIEKGALHNIKILKIIRHAFISSKTLK